MTLEFPRFVFKNHGKCLRPGGTYSEMLVEDLDAYSAAIVDGWSKTLPEALDDLVVAPVKAKRKEA